MAQQVLYGWVRSAPSPAASVGELLLAPVGLSRRLGVDPELALRGAADRFRDSAT